MRVFCPEHKRGFFAPRQSPVRCENRGHVLGEIDFEGEGKTPLDVLWQYCCNCEHFCPVDFEQYGLQRCPVCTRKSSLLYLCDRCHVISFESNTPLQIKNFTLSSEGVPQPSCPGCLRPASADLHEHTCDELNVSFITGLNACPICNERLDIAPAFPLSVAQYLKRTRSANKINVTFDYETGAFVPVEDGELVIVTNVDQNAIVLPRAAKFSARRDFYEFYQDYYHCPNPDAGEVRIIEPAIVGRAGNGWTLKATGVLEVIADEQPKKKIVAPPLQPTAVRQPVQQEVRQEEPAPVLAEKKEQPDLRACPECGSMIESRYAFCWKCGHSLEQQRKSQTTNGRKPDMSMSSISEELEDDEQTVQHEIPPLSSKLFSWTTGSTPEHRGPGKSSVLKLMSIGAIAFLLGLLGLYGLLRSDTPTATATVAQPPAQIAPQPAPSVSFTTEVSRAAPTETTTQQVAGPEDELKKLREKRLTASASASERSKIFQAFKKIEKQYPRDYRFPYERAKLVVKGSQANSREAFKALNNAAEKAISAGKANEMLNGLETDKTGDFSRLSQGRYEWGRLVAALKRKDPSLLSE
ncbi:MAG TPA: hypothetical protein VJW17_04950 [Pyrinomonadaceae bacterium]|nr:hypothetical protein [Pyrinomonadaceae bacterium]